MLAPLKRIRPASAARHSVRILTILAKASFWALCYHYFGTEALLYVAASWTFLLGIKDFSFVRVRLASLRDPAKRRAAFNKSVIAELLLIAVRLAAIFALAGIVGLFNRDVAAVIPVMAIAAGFWARETFVATSSLFGTGSMRAYVAFVAAAAALGSIIYFAENGLDPLHSAVWALLIREGLTFFGFGFVALLGCLGVRSKGEVDDDDDEDGGETAPVVAPDGREVRSAWKLLIADNVIYSRWRMMHFATRFVAHGILGPLGGIATRIAFSYRKPRPYEHHQDRISAGKVVAMAAGAAAVISVIIYVGETFGLLHAIGVLAAAFLFRVAGLSLNLLFWRQLSPTVGAPRKARNDVKWPAQVSESDQGEGPGSPSSRLGETE